MLSMAFLMGGCLRISIPVPFRDFEFSHFWDNFAVICYFKIRPHGMKHFEVSVVHFFPDADKKQKKKQSPVPKSGTEIRWKINGTLRREICFLWVI